MIGLLRQWRRWRGKERDPLESLNPRLLNVGPPYQMPQWDFKRARCPDCGGQYFHPGPQGGDAVNIKCAGCGAKFWYGPPFTPHRIDNDDNYYNLNVVRKLEDL